MSKKVLVISTSLRTKGNSAALAAAFAEGAKEAGHEVETVSLAGKKLEFCRGCFVCQTTRKCVIQDDASLIARKMLTADVLVFSTPIYYYEMSGQMKTMLDRANPLFPSDYAFRDVYLLAVAADEDEKAMEGAVKGMSGWIACFPKARLAGTLFGGGVTNVGDIAGKTVLDAAREMGRKI